VLFVQHVTYSHTQVHATLMSLLPPKFRGRGEIAVK
jgi:hypothetical protein